MTVVTKHSTCCRPRTTKDDRNKIPIASSRSSSLMKKRKQRLRSVQWSSQNPEVHHGTANDICENKEEIWYSMKEYKEFHVDRFRTIECLRASGGNEKLLNPDFYCCRGLEPFWTPENHQELHSSRRIHKSTVILEQARQNLLKIKDPERFRVMVAPQSEMALHRAQEQAALDALQVRDDNGDNDDDTNNGDDTEVSSAVSSSSAAAAAEKSGTSSKVPSLSRLSPNTVIDMSFHKPNVPPPAMSLSPSVHVRALQELNARRLIRMYSPAVGDGGGMSTGTTNAAMGGGRCLSFRFPLRRDSLIGGAKFLNTMMMASQQYNFVTVPGRR